MPPSVGPVQSATPNNVERTFMGVGTQCPSKLSIQPRRYAACQCEAQERRRPATRRLGLLVHLLVGLIVGRTQNGDVRHGVDEQALGADVGRASVEASE